MRLNSRLTATFAGFVWAWSVLFAPVRILKAQGPHAHGGAKDYVVDGSMTGGFAVLAYPVEYGASGVMSFLASRRGKVLERDLGSSTAETAAAIKTFDPDPAWKRVK